VTRLLLAAALLAGAAAAWRATLAWSRSRLAAVEAQLATMTRERDDARAAAAARTRELDAAQANVAGLREQVRQLAGRDPVAAANDLADAFEGLRRPR